MSFSALALGVFCLVSSGCRSLESKDEISEILKEENPAAGEQIEFLLRGTKYRLVLPTDLAGFLPAWDAESGSNPGMPPGKAVVLARNALNRNFRDAAEWALNSVELREVPVVDPLSGLPVPTGKWFYEVAFRPPEERLNPKYFDLEVLNSGVDSYHHSVIFSYFILPNGIVIEPRPFE